MNKGPGRYDKARTTDIKELEGWNDVEFVKLFLEYCISKGAKVYKIIAPSSYENISKDGVITKITPAVTLEPINNIKESNFTGSGLFVRADEADYLIWFGSSEQTNIPWETLYFDEGLVKILWTSVHVYRKEGIPQSPRPRDLQALRTVSSERQMQYIRKVGLYKDKSMSVLEHELEIFPPNDTDPFLQEFISMMKLKHIERILKRN